MKHTQNKLSFSSTTGLFLIVLATGCSYSVTSHQFMYHGTDFPQTDKDFFYVEEGIFGSASAEYDNRGGGHVREGLVADAKADMKIGHPLGINQAYANLSIDLMETETGTQAPLSGVREAHRIELTAVVTADVIQFGDAATFQSINRSGGLLQGVKSSSGEATLNVASDTKSPKIVETVLTEKKETDELSFENSISNKFNIGQKVQISFGGRFRPATIENVEWSADDEQFIYKCQYFTNSGSKRYTDKLESEISQE